MLAAYATTAWVVPVLAPVAISDDWIYTRSVEMLLDGEGLRILPVAAANAIFQIIWAAPFAALTENRLGAVRLATVVFGAVSAVVFYALCRELDLTKARSAIGSALYLFNPLSFVLWFTFMTDAYFMGLVVAATYAFVRSLRRGPAGDVDVRWLLAMAAASSLAYLQRPMGVLLTLSGLVSLAIGGHLRRSARSARIAAAVGALPAVTVILHRFWLRAVNGDQAAQSDFFGAVLDVGVRDSVTIVTRMIFVMLAYAGFFAVPIMVALVRRLPRLAEGTTRLGWVFFGLWLTIIVGALASHARGGPFPYVPQFFQSEGAGPSEIRGGRSPIFGIAIANWLTIVTILSSLALALVVGRALALQRMPWRSKIAAVIVVGIIQAGGALLPSFLFWDLGLSLSLDRYLLPTVPFVIVLALWATRDVPGRLVVAWGVTIVMGLYSLATTRDYVVYQQAIWSVATDAVADGIDETELDGGYPWNGYHLYERSVAAGIPRRSTAGEPFWTAVIAPIIDPRHVVAYSPQPGYEVVARRPYSSWTNRRHVELLLLERTTEPGAAAGD